MDTENSVINQSKALFYFSDKNGRHWPVLLCVENEQGDVDVFEGLGCDRDFIIALFADTKYHGSTILFHGLGQFTYVYTHRNVSHPFPSLTYVYRKLRWGLYH